MENLNESRNCLIKELQENKKSNTLTLDIYNKNLFFTLSKELQVLELPNTLALYISGDSIKWVALVEGIYPHTEKFIFRMSPKKNDKFMIDALEGSHQATICISNGKERIYLKYLKPLEFEICQEKDAKDLARQYQWNHGIIQ